jgi:hypothetical protein
LLVLVRTDLPPVAEGQCAARELRDEVQVAARDHDPRAFDCVAHHEAVADPHYCERSFQLLAF